MKQVAHFVRHMLFYTPYISFRPLLFSIFIPCVSVLFLNFVIAHRAVRARAPNVERTLIGRGAHARRPTSDRHSGLINGNELYTDIEKTSINRMNKL